MNTHPPLGPLRDDLQDSPEGSEEEAEDGGREIAAAPGTGAEAEAGQLTIVGVLEEEVVGGDAAELGGGEEVQGDSTEEEVLPSTEGMRQAARELQALVAGHWLQEEVE